eukprot:TRINITY_DN6547_c0_g2_i1.p1 TRINITY_DN6547_c0_g2~~TRINITY_DN6547_c0_g2_i1.p1  ORF type:complete len:280 (-),score=18.96 TRINITY_DN6547_c0_g2_i1:26-865(-)
MGPASRAEKVVPLVYSKAVKAAMDAYNLQCDPAHPPADAGVDTKRTTRFEKNFVPYSNMTLEFMKAFRTCGKCAAGPSDLQRVGGKRDGGYFVCNQAVMHSVGAISVGIRGDDSWGIAVSEMIGAPIHMYDCTDAKVPRCPESSAGKCSVDFHYVCVGQPFRDDREFEPLGRIVQQHASADSDLVLKLDCEGCEWKVIDDIEVSTLVRFRTIVFEFHWLDKRGNHELYLRVMRKLLSRFRLVHTHGCIARTLNIYVEISLFVVGCMISSLFILLYQIDT